jgi:hypothetical protein
MYLQKGISCEVALLIRGNKGIGRGTNGRSPPTTQTFIIIVILICSRTLIRSNHFFVRLEMLGLRSRKEASKSPGEGAERNGISKGRRTGSSKHGSCLPSVHPGCIGVVAVVMFIIFLKATAPPPHKRYIGMDQSPLRHGLQKSMFSDGHGKQVQKVGRTGKVNHKAITTVKKEDLKGLVPEADLPENMESITYEEAIQGREHLLDILTDAGVEELDVPTILSLPKWSQVTKLYGDGPVVIGLETCQTFRDTIPVDDASIGTAGVESAALTDIAAIVVHVRLTLFLQFFRHVQHWHESIWNVH